MKNLLLAVMSIVFIQSVHADDYAKLRIKISGATNDNRYFLCVGNVGCVSIKAGNAGKVYPMQSGDINYIYTTNVANQQLYTQGLPSSCDFAVKNNQTVTITGKLKTGPNNKTYLSNLDCKVA
jgi:hypothetical protein